MFNRKLAEENEQLKKRIENLEGQISDLLKTLHSAMVHIDVSELATPSGAHVSIKKEKAEPKEPERPREGISITQLYPDY